MADARAAVVLVTDFGTDDSYAGSLVGALWTADPDARWATGTHGVPPGDVLAGAYHVKALARSFPAGTVICAVVDPGVGTDRRAIAVEADGVLCVAPDNGLCTWLWEEAGDRRCVAVPVPPEASPTFAGRDLFAPIAARLAAGAVLDDCGPRIDDPILLPTAFPRRVRTALYARVCVVDRFGNAITTARLGDLAGARAVAASWNGGGTRRVARTYADIGAGLALVAGSAGHLEIAARGVPAASRGGPAEGASVRITLGPG
jgi:S-adenosyl-L-methionine hydrolase (adenosine-forming)